MHHPKEAVIDGVKFVLIPEELIDEVISTLRSDPNHARMSELAQKLEDA